MTLHRPRVLDCDPQALQSVDVQIKQVYDVVYVMGCGTSVTPKKTGAVAPSPSDQFDPVSVTHPYADTPASATRTILDTPVMSIDSSENTPSASSQKVIVPLDPLLVPIDALVARLAPLTPGTTVRIRQRTRCDVHVLRRGSQRLIEASPIKPARVLGLSVRRCAEERRRSTPNPSLPAEVIERLDELRMPRRRTQ
ncbi:MAG: hypothetical protein JKY23_00490 [Nitrospinaceae bacterium]|nr:hypothetical protein [Nitrospinaceae bacterium]